MREYKRLTMEGIVFDNIINCVVCPNKTEKYTCRKDKINCLKAVINRLAELEDKIENGTLIELPCKVETTLYFIVTEEQEDINGFKYGILESNKWLYVIDKNGEITIEENDLFFKFEYTYDYTFGENAFLTKAEAEAKLKELQNERD